jgi:hypothetical protein
MSNETETDADHGNDCSSPHVVGSMRAGGRRQGGGLSAGEACCCGGAVLTYDAWRKQRIKRAMKVLKA